MQPTRDKAGRPIVVVTGMGVVTSLGAGKTENWRRLTAGQSGIRAITRFSTDGLRTKVAGTVDFVPAEPFCAPALAERLAEMVIEEAIGEAEIGGAKHFPGPLFLAAPPVEIEWLQRRALVTAARADDAVDYDELLRLASSGGFRSYHERLLFGSVAEHLAARFGTQGSPITLSTACASGASAIQLGFEAIRRGEADAALCVATDGSINPESVVRFSLLSALSTHNEPPAEAAKPFAKNRDGFVMAEGAGALVLESYDAAKARGARILGVIEGCGEMADAFHRTRSSPDGKPIIGSIHNAIADAGLGERAKQVPISSNKSMIGHTLSAAGAVEAIFTLLTLEHQRIPPTINYKIPDPAIPLDVVPNLARDAGVRHALSNSFGFGGQNVSLVMGREPS